MSVPISQPRGKPTASAPIPIASRKPATTAKPSINYLSASVPAAPIIGSLKAPTHLENTMPDLALPPSSPEAFSLALANTEQLNARVVGVSSAPARTFIEHAKRSSASVPLGTSPTVLSILSSSRTGDSFIKSGLGPSHVNTEPHTVFAKISATSSSTAAAGQTEGGLSSIFRKGATGGVPHAGQGPTGAPIVLAASFRDASRIPIPVSATISEVDSEEELLSDSDNEVEKRNTGRQPARKGLDSDDEDDMHHARGHSDHGDIFEGEF